MAAQQGFINKVTRNADGTYSGEIGADTGNRIIDFTNQALTNYDGSPITDVSQIPADSYVDYYPNGNKAEMIKKLVELSVSGVITDSSVKAHLRNTVRSVANSSDTGIVITIRK